MRARILEPALDIALREGRAPERALHQIVLAVDTTLLAQELVPGRKRSPDRTASVTGRRLHPDVREGAVAQDLAVGDAIECHAARQAEIVEPMLAPERARQSQH